MTPSLRAPGRWLRGPPLGSGSFGKVSLGLSLDDGLLFAVKSAPLPPSPQMSSLQNELRLLRTLDSPRVVRCLGADVSLVDRVPCFNLFLEYMQEGSIADLMKKSGGKLDETSAAACTRAVLEGLCYLHQEGIVHSDIKAQNILLGSRGEIKIADFGTATRVSSSQNSESCRMKGTPLWMAPEVLQGVEQGTPSDIWSLGCTVVEMLQGMPPWGSNMQGHPSPEDLLSLLFKIACTSEALPLVESSLSAEAGDFVSKCLHRDPAQRWTAQQLLQHPFVMVKEGVMCGDGSQPSPRSALDFYADSDTDSETCGSLDTFMGCVYTAEPSCGGRQQKGELYHEERLGKDRSIYWRTLWCAEGWSEDRQKPFFRTGKKLVLRKGSEVSFESAGFLAKRVGARMG